MFILWRHFCIWWRHELGEGKQYNVNAFFFEFTTKFIFQDFVCWSLSMKLNLMSSEFLFIFYFYFFFWWPTDHRHIKLVPAFLLSFPFTLCTADTCIRKKISKRRSQWYSRPCRQVPININYPAMGGGGGEREEKSPTSVPDKCTRAQAM